MPEMSSDITSRDILLTDRALCPLSPRPQEDRDPWRSWQSVFRGVLWSKLRPGQTKTILWRCQSWSWPLWKHKTLSINVNHADDDDNDDAGKDTDDLSQRNWNWNDTQVDNEKRNIRFLKTTSSLCSIWLMNPWMCDIMVLERVYFKVLNDFKKKYIVTIYSVV